MDVKQRKQIKPEIGNKKGYLIILKSIVIIQGYTDLGTSARIGHWLKKALWKYQGIQGLHDELSLGVYGWWKFGIWIWWIFSLILSVIFCGMMIYEIFQKYIHYPVLVTFSMQETRIQEIPFPAVTVCPRSKISQTFFNMTEMILKNNTNTISSEEERQLNIASTLCEFYPSDNNNNRTKEEDFYDFLIKSRIHFLDYCQYLGKEMNCSDIFTPVLTEDGICYSFNILDKKDIFNDFVEFKFPDFHKSRPAEHWDTEKGYTEPIIETYPRRALRIGAKNSLLVIFKVKKSDVEYECPLDETGYRVTLHLPSKILEVPENYFTVPLDQRVTGSIIPHIIKTSKEVRKFDVSKRDCYFQSERRLKFFKIYTQENCVIECKTNHVLKYCGCVGFYMPKIPGTPICLLSKIKCMEEAEFNYALSNENLGVLNDGNEDGKLASNCDCRPTCTDINYGLELSQNSAKWIPISRFNLETFDKNSHYSILNLFFKKNHIETKERNELYGFSDVISNFGGLLGLFTGFSILSFTEIIYFLSLRIWANIRLYGIWTGRNKDN